MDKYALFGKLTTDPKDRDALLAILDGAVKIMEGIAECKQYILYKDALDEGIVWVSEIWESKKAHEESLTREDVRTLISQAVPLLKGAPEGGVQLVPVSGKGL